MDLSQSTRLAKHFEGFRSKPYLCPAGVATIGYGATHYEDGRRVTLEDAPITEARAAELLAFHLASTYAPGVHRMCPGLLPLALLQNDWGKFNAIVDFAFNLGTGRLQTSTLRRKLNAQDWQGAIRELKRWVRGGGRVLPGLVKRRSAEAALFA
jgi:lysozyme